MATLGHTDQGYVLVTVKHAANLKDTELLGKQEPYVRLQLGGEKIETTTEKGVNPVFNEQVKLPLPSSYFSQASGARELHVSVYNEKTLLPDRLIGHGRVSLSKADDSGSQTVPLYDKRGNPAGHVVLQLSVHDGANRGTDTTYATSQQHHSDKTGIDSTTASLASTHITAPATHTHHTHHTHATHTTNTESIPFAPTSGRVVSAHEYATITDHPVTKEVREQYAETTPILHEAVAHTKHVGDVALPTTAEVVDHHQQVVDQRATPTVAVPAPQRFAVVEDHSQLKEQVQVVKETTPVERLYETTTREKGAHALPSTTEVLGQREEVVDQRGTGAPVLPQPQQFSTVECHDTLRERRERFEETQGVERVYAKETKHVGDVALPGSAEVVDEKTFVREA